MPMHNPSHPGRILKLSLGDMDVTEAASHLNIARPTLSKILNGRAGISAEMAERLARFFGNSSIFWMNLQTNFDLAGARKKKGFLGRLKKVIPYSVEQERTVVR
jgi:addiction module HigA family antidote